jgi:methylthioribose-1-phosphate isomerase
LEAESSITTRNVNTVEWRDSDNTLLLIDQTLLPHQFVLVECRTYQEVGEAIRTMKVRGAPAIGITAAFGMALAALQSSAISTGELLNELNSAANFLAATRPTAVNLKWAIERCLENGQKWVKENATLSEIKANLLALAKFILEEDIAGNKAMGAFGAQLIKENDNVLTHCNAGGLATGGYGTAVGVIRAAHEAGKTIHVWVDETRPYLQGARLTAWELQQAGIPLTLITDNMAGHLMQRGMVQFVVTGADRIAANGDSANKIGTYMLAVLAKEHNIPFYIAAPLSTVDLSLASGDLIPIEERSTEEVTVIGGKQIAPHGVKAAHPAFDVTPAKYIHGIITERGIARPPYKESLPALFGQKNIILGGDFIRLQRTNGDENEVAGEGC